MSRRPAQPKKALPVLLLGAQGIEYLGAGTEGRRYAQQDAEELEVGPAVAAHAAELVRSVGAEPGPCVLALGHSLLQQRIVNLPELPAKELRASLLRKAAALIEQEPEDTFFSALQLDVEDDDKERKWLVMATPSRPYLALRYALREQGFVLKRTVSERLALAARSMQQADEESEGACIAVGMETDATGVHLMHEGDLVNQTVLPSRFEDCTDMAKVVVQELRGFDAFWRRRSRGGTIGTVVLVGLPPRWAERLEFAVRAALPGADIHRLVRDAAEGMRGARVVALDACRATNTAIQLSFDTPLKPRVRSLVAAAFTSAALAAFATFSVLERSEVRRDRVHRERASLALRAADLHDVKTKMAEVDGALDALARERRRAEVLGRFGLPLDAALGEVLRATAGRAGVKTISLGGEEDDSRALHLSGEVPSEPLAAHRALNGILAAAARSELLVDLEIDTPRVGSDASGALEFAARGTVGGAR